ncbi:inorganic diphosphatase, partial [Acinetobacter baumannii]
MKGIKSINCVVETPKGYGIKYDYDPRLGRLFVKKRLPAGLVFPFDFGYIPGTMGEDGDPLDVVMISEMQVFPRCSVDCRIIGSLKVV